MKRTPVGATQTEQEKAVERDKILFAETLNRLKAGAIIAFNTSIKGLDQLRVGKEKKREIEKFCGKANASVKGLFTRINKLITLEWEVDLRDGVGPDTALLVQQLLNFDVMPCGPLELVSGQQQYRPRDDKILFHNFEVTEVTHDAPFELCFASNIHDYVVDTISAIGDPKVYVEKKEKHEPFATLKEFPSRDSMMILGPRLTKYRPPENERRLLNIDRTDEENTHRRLLANFQPEMAAICAIMDKENIWNGTVVFQMQHPISKGMTDFVAMHFTHVMAIFAVQNWKQWNLAMGPLPETHCTVTSNLVIHIYPKDFCDKLAAELVADFPQRPPLFPSNSMSFGICRTIEDDSSWVIPFWCEKDIATAEDLRHKYHVAITILLDYSLLPQSIGRRALLMAAAGHAQLGIAYDNTKEHERELKDQAQAELAQKKVAVDLSKIDVNDEGEEEEKMEGETNTEAPPDAMET
jgi:hypothetical protein